MIQTVTGSIEAPKGSVLTHEHIWCVSNDMNFITNGSWTDEKAVEDYCVKILRELKSRYGVDVFVDGTPWDLGRSIRLLENVSKRSGVNIVASTGLYYFTSLISFNVSAEKLAQMFTAECKKGIAGTNIRPGILKCAAGGTTLTEDEKKRITALGITQRETGLPLYVHSFHQGSVTQEIIEALLASGADLGKTAIGHTGLRPEADYLEQVLQQGVYICVDQCFEGSEKANAEAVAQLCRRGWQEKILCSLDHTCYSDFCDEGYKGLEYPYEKHVKDIGFLFDVMLTEFQRAGCTAEQCNAFVKQNPCRFLNIEVSEQ